MYRQFLSYRRRIGSWLWFIVGCSLACRPEPDPIKIGAIIPLTGAASQHAVFVDAMALAVEEINHSGGVNGRKLALIVQDSHSDSEHGVAAFQRIEKEHAPLCFLTTTSVVSLALAPLAEAKGVVLVGMAASAPRLTRGYRWVFRYYVTPQLEVAPVCRHLHRLKAQTLGILYQDDSFGRSMMEAVSQGVASMGTRVESLPFSTTAPGFKEKTSHFRGMDAVYVVGFVNMVGQAVQAVRGHGYTGAVLSHSGVSSLLYAKPELAAQIEGVYLSAPIIYNPNYVFARGVKGRYEQRFKQAFTHQAANGYDVIHILAGLMQGESLSRGRLRELLEGEFFYPGVFGYIEKGAGAHCIAFPLYPAQIVNGTVQYLQ